MVDDRWRDDERRRWHDDRNRHGWQGHGRSGWSGNQGRPRPYYERPESQADYDRLGQGQDYDRRFGEGGYGQGYGRYGEGGFGQGYGGGGFFGEYNRNRGYGGGYGGETWRGGSEGEGEGWAPGGADTGYRGGRENQRSWWDRASDEVSSWMGDEEAERRRRMDHARGGHYGKGPRGYTRSDDRIREDIHDRLTDDWMLDASNITVAVSGGEVTLDGTVNSREDKRRAEDLADNVSGVRHVQNNLRVQQQGSETAASTSATRSSPGSSTARSTR
ncbi:MAG TPA: BON domain-containing protein [Aestuariivirgaceae bacterium]|nr:BON domain-containing protein [Aestuariivirgaceae bacterium]